MSESAPVALPATTNGATAAPRPMADARARHRLPGGAALVNATAGLGIGEIGLDLFRAASGPERGGRLAVEPDPRRRVGGLCAATAWFDRAPGPLGPGPGPA